MMLVGKNLKKTFSTPEKLTLFSGVDITIETGETVAILGRSGEGKSTLLNILGTLDQPTEGELLIRGDVITDSMKSSLRNELMGFVFQSFHLLEDYTVLQNVLMPAYIGRKSIDKGSKSYTRALSLLDKVGLRERLHHFGKQLSGGEKQRVAIARALVNDPAILFADEPSGNLDRQTAQGIHSLLLQFAKEGGKSLVIVTHDLELANLTDTIYELKNGTLSKVKR